MTDTAFLEADEQALAQRFIDDGFVTTPADDRAGLDRINGAPPSSRRII